MAGHAPAARRKQRRAVRRVRDRGALGLLTAALAAWADPSAPAWQWLRPVALLAAGAIPARLAFEAAAYCAQRAEHPARHTARLTHWASGSPKAPAASTHSFGRAPLPGRDALPSGSAHT